MSQQINLFNPQMLRQKHYFSVRAMLQSLTMILFGAVLFYVYAAYQVQNLTNQSAEENKRFASAQDRLARYSAEFSPQQAKQLMEDELKRSETQVQLQRELIATLKSGAIGNTNGYSEYMRAFARQTVGGLWLTGFDITGDAIQMNMRGGALNPELVPGFIKRLGAEKVMRGKVFAALQILQHKVEAGKPAGKPYLEFTLQSAEASGAVK